MHSLDNLHNFQRFFSGRKDAHGVHIHTDKKGSGGKRKGESFTKTAMVTEKKYIQHLEGKKGLGIVPIMKDNKCSFCAIDVDEYDRDYRPLIRTVYTNSMPVVPFSTKSGGLHLLMFFVSPIKAKTAIQAMQDIVRLLALRKETEIFPKQASVNEMSIGSWINLPYFNADKPRNGMYDLDGNIVSLDECLTYIQNRIQTEESLLEFFGNLPLSDAPPCLQAIYFNGDTSHRNNYLFSVARYFKSKEGDDFEHSVTDANNRLINPIPVKELNDTIISAHKKKDYSYKCSDAPIAGICNKKICRTRKFGIGGEEISELNYGEFRQFKADPPYYEWIVNEKVLRFFDETEIIMQHKFRKLCFQKLHVLPVRLKDTTWSRIVNRALKNIVILDVPEEEDMSTGAVFKEFLTEFLERRAMAKTKEQILTDRVFKDDDVNSYIFKPKNLLQFLIGNKQFRAYGYTEIQARLRDMGGRPKRYYINSAIGAARVWVLPYNGLTKFIEDPLDSFEVDFTENEEENKDGQNFASKPY